MRPGRLGAQKATQELRSSGTGRLASFLLHRPERGRPSATREPSPLALARSLALPLPPTGSQENSPRGGCVGLRFSFCFLFVCFFYLSTRPG